MKRELEQEIQCQQNQLQILFCFPLSQVFLFFSFAKWSLIKSIVFVTLFLTWVSVAVVPNPKKECTNAIEKNVNELCLQYFRHLFIHLPLHQDPSLICLLDAVSGSDFSCEGYASEKNQLCRDVCKQTLVSDGTGSAYDLDNKG